MATKSLDAQIQARIESFTAELTVLIRRSAIEAVEGVLGGASPRAPKRPAKGARKPRASSKRIRRTAADLERISGLVSNYVAQNPGDRLEQISDAIGIDSKELKKPILDLLAAGVLKKEGQKRGTRYLPGSTKAKAPRRKASRKKARRKAAKKSKRAA